MRARWSSWFVVLLLPVLGCDASEATPAAPADAIAQPAAPPAAAGAPAPAAAPAAAAARGPFVCCDTPAATALVGAYLDAQAALAADDDARARTALGALVGTYLDAQAALAGADADTAALLAAVATDATAAATAPDIKARRERFKPLSAAMVRYARQHAGGERSVAEAFCPMANGSWLQESRTIANPYYGAEMLTCGSFR